LDFIIELHDALAAAKVLQIPRPPVAPPMDDAWLVTDFGPLHRIPEATLGQADPHRWPSQWFAPPNPPVAGIRSLTSDTRWYPFDAGKRPPYPRLTLEDDANYYLPIVYNFFPHPNDGSDTHPLIYIDTHAPDSPFLPPLPPKKPSSTSLTPNATGSATNGVNKGTPLVAAVVIGGEKKHQKDNKGKDRKAKKDKARKSKDHDKAKSPSQTPKSGAAPSSLALPSVRLLFILLSQP
jgi:hypothetical protein